MIEVGKILFIVRQSPRGITPALVIEEVVRRTLTGSTIEHVVQFPDGKRTILSEILGSVFPSSEDCKQYLIHEATLAIESLVVRAEEISREKFTNLEKDQEIRSDESSSH